MNLSDDLKKYEFLETASEIAEQLEMKTYIVGGFIRDILLNRKRDDIDFLIVGDGPKYASSLANTFGIKDIVIYKNFGTAHFRYHDINFEFVGARKESYNKSSRKPDVSAGSFKDDISRRDFTINTLAVSINKKNYGELVDTYNGLADIENGIIFLSHDAGNRTQEWQFDLSLRLSFEVENTDHVGVVADVGYIEQLLV